MSQELINSFILMGKGMLGIFVVIILLTVIVMLLGRKSKKDK